MVMDDQRAEILRLLNLIVDELDGLDPGGMGMPEWVCDLVRLVQAARRARADVEASLAAEVAAVHSVDDLHSQYWGVA